MKISFLKTLDESNKFLTKFSRKRYLLPSWMTGVNVDKETAINKILNNFILKYKYYYHKQTQRFFFSTLHLDNNVR